MASRFLDEFKAYTEADTTDTSLDDVRSLILDSSEAYLEKMCNISIAENTKTLTLNGTGMDSIYLDVSPINSITSIKIDNEVKDVNDFFVHNNYLYFKETSTFTAGIQNIEVVVATGYSTLEIPSDLKLAILKLTDKLFTDATDNRDGISGYDNGVKLGEHYTHSELPDTVKAIIYTHKRWVI